LPVPASLSFPLSLSLSLSLLLAYLSQAKEKSKGERGRGGGGGGGGPVGKCEGRRRGRVAEGTRKEEKMEEPEGAMLVAMTRKPTRDGSRAKSAEALGRTP